MQYLANRDYRGQYGEWTLSMTAGDAVELSDEIAAWVDRDCPGTLTPVPVVASTTGTPDDTGTASLDNPPQDRMIRKGRKR